MNPYYNPTNGTRLGGNIKSVGLLHTTAYLAGVPTARDPGDKGELWVLDGKDGRRLQTLTLDAYPVYDGLSAAGGRLFMVTEEGGIIWFGTQ